MSVCCPTLAVEFAFFLCLVVRCCFVCVFSDVLDFVFPFFGAVCIIFRGGRSARRFSFFTLPFLLSFGIFFLVSCVIFLSFFLLKFIRSR